MDESYIGLVLKDRYELISLLGRGGMGFVMKARDTYTGEFCAVKFLREHITSVNEKRRFQREFQIISQLKNPHVVKSMDCGEYDHDLYIVMEFIRGQSLSELLDQELGGQLGEGLEPQLVLRLVLDVIVGLSEAHRLGVIHRDLKPDNIMVSYDKEGALRAKVIDFGVAKPFDETSQGMVIEDQLTDKNMIIGTPKYMAPEQFLRERVDHRTDLYSVGVLMYLMLSGIPPFQHGNPAVPKDFMQIPEYQILWQHVNLAPEPLPVHPLLWDLISDLLQKDMNKRPDSTREVMMRLEDLIEIVSQTEEETHRTGDFALTALMDEIPEMSALLAQQAQDSFSVQASRQTQPLAKSELNTEELDDVLEAVPESTKQLRGSEKPLRGALPASPSRGGMSTSGRIFIVIIVLVAILGVAYQVNDSARSAIRSAYTVVYDRVSPLLNSIYTAISSRKDPRGQRGGGVKIVPKTQVKTRKEQL